jgi:hypothetical protein
MICIIKGKVGIVIRRLQLTKINIRIKRTKGGAITASSTMSIIMIIEHRGRMLLVDGDGYFSLDMVVHCCCLEN